MADHTGTARTLCKVEGQVKYTSFEGTSRWKTGNLELAFSATGQVMCVVNYKIGRSKKFILTNQIKGVITNQQRCVINLKCGTNINYLNKDNNDNSDNDMFNQILQELRHSRKGGGPAPHDFTLINQRLMVPLGENSSLPSMVQLDEPVATADADGSAAAANPLNECCSAATTPSSNSQHRSQSMTGPRKRTRTKVNDEEYGKLLILEQKRTKAETRRAEVEIEKILLEKERIGLQIALMQQSFNN